MGWDHAFEGVFGIGIQPMGGYIMAFAGFGHTVHR